MLSFQIATSELSLFSVLKYFDRVLIFANLTDIPLVFIVRKICGKRLSVSGWR